MTPLVDITFQLIVFFMVVSQVVTAERAPMNLPAPVHSQAREKRYANRLVINLFSGKNGNISKIKVNANVVNGLDELVDVLLREGPVLQSKHGTVILRADRDIRFDKIEKVMRAISNSGVSSLQIAAEQENKSGDKTQK